MDPSSFCGDIHLFQNHVFKKPILSLPYHHCSFVKSNLAVYVLSFGNSYLFTYILSILFHYLFGFLSTSITVLIAIDLWYLKSTLPSFIFCSFSVILAILDFLHFHVIFFFSLPYWGSNPGPYTC